MPQLNETKSFTNHCGIVDFKGHSYFFYHTGTLPGGGGFDRSTAIEEFKWNADGTIPTIMPTRAGVTPIANLMLGNKVEAETIGWSEGVTTEQTDHQVYVADIHNGDWFKVRQADFADGGSKTVTVRVASATQGGNIEIYADSIGGKPLVTIAVPNTNGWEHWTTLTGNISNCPAGVHDLYFAFRGQKGRKLMNFDWWCIAKK